jgi:pimeloyl-ACP methyl ester carboxylesterase
VLDQYIAGARTPQQVFDYYFGWLTNPKISPHFQAPPDSSVAFARQWGMDVTIGDLHQVVDRAKQLGGKVVLGGHSLGGTVTTAHATWDFDGKAGAEDLDGIVLIDGGTGAGSPISVSDAQVQLQKLHDPNGASLAYNWPPFPAMLKPPVLPTNAAQYGYALDTKTGPPSLRLVQMHIGARRERHAARLAQRLHHAGGTCRRGVRRHPGNGRHLVVPPSEAVAPPMP